MLVRRSAAALLLLFAAGAAFAQTPNAALIGDSVPLPEAPEFSKVADAIRRFGNRDFTGAQTLLEQARAADSRLPPASVMIAKLHLMSGNRAAFRTALEQCHGEAPGDPEPSLMLGREARTQNRLIEAEALLCRALELAEGYADCPKRQRLLRIRALQGRVAVHQSRRDWEPAEADLRAWIIDAPEDPVAHNLLGSVLVMQEKDREALDAFKQATRFDKSLPNPYVTAGSVLVRRGDIASAVESFRRAYRDDEQSEVNASQYANVLLISGAPAEARPVLERSRKEHPESFNLWLLSGVSASMEGDTASAVQAFEQSLRLRPANVDALLQMSRVLIEAEDATSRQRAQQYALVNVRLHENDPNAQVMLAWVLERVGDRRGSEAALSKGVKLGQLGPDSQLLVAKLFLAREQLSAAKRLLENATADKQNLFLARQEAEELLAKLP